MARLIELTDLQEAQLTVAEARGKELSKTAMRAASARYDPVSGLVLIDLTNGCIYGFPPQHVQDLANASPVDLAGVEVDSLGFNLHWPALEVDLDVPALVAGIFGTKAWMAREFARHAGQAKSPAKAAASRENGAKGGRPRKDEQALTIVEESLAVGKREVGRGNVRVRSYLLQEQTTEEGHVPIERHSVFSGTFPGDAFRERTIEMTEIRGDAVARKDPRVVAVIHRDAENRTETVSDPVRSNTSPESKK